MFQFQAAFIVVSISDVLGLRVRFLLGQFGTCYYMDLDGVLLGILIKVVINIHGFGQ